MQPVGGSLPHVTFMSMPGGIPPIKMVGLVSSFQYEGNKSMVAETLEDYALDYTEAYY